MNSRFSLASRWLHRLPESLFVPLVLLVIGAALTWNIYADYQRTMEQEYRLLALRALQHEARISGALRSVTLMLDSIIADLPDHPGLSAAQASKQLKDHLRLLPELRNLLIVDGAGRIRADARDTSVGKDASDREYFKRHRDAPAGGALDISRPFKTFGGVTATTLSRVVRDAQGRFAGVALAALEPSYFDGALTLTADESGIQTLLINREGDILNMVPDRGDIGNNLRGGPSYTEHIDSGKATTRHLNVTKVSPAMRLSVIHDLPGAPLSVIVSRDYDAVMAGWRLSLYGLVASFLLVAATMIFFSVLAARRRTLLARDITEKKLAESALKDSESRLAAVFQASPIGIVVSRIADGKILDGNDAALRLYGYTREEALGRTVADLGAYAKPAQRAQMLQRLTEQGSIDCFAVDYRARDGRVGTLEVSARVIEVQGEPCLLSMMTDVTERRRVEEQIFDLAFNDALTHLPNRRLLKDRLGQAMATSKRSGHYGALMFIDMDNFKPLNDRHGHAVGDLLLIEVASRLNGCVRDMDTVARFGGDEFVVMLSKLETDKAESLAEATIVAEKIRVALARPYLLTIKREGEPDAVIEHRCSASVGVSLFIDHEATQDDVLRYADNAMYQAKEAGRNAVRFYGEGP